MRQILQSADNKSEGQLLGNEIYLILGGVVVKVISKNGKLLMPTNRHGKVRRLLKEKKAKVICKTPFTIQLLYKTTDKTQHIDVGINLGYRYNGFALIANGFAIQKGTIELRQNVPSLLITRSALRRDRRSRLRYRPARFDNRTRPKGWLPPSTQSKYNHILSWIDKICAYLPRHKLTVEIANFDVAKIINPDISGKEYQQGSLYRYENIKQYLLAREKGRCQYCGKPYIKNDRWNIHHIIPRSKGGTDRSANIALLHESCHIKLHKNKEFSKIKKAKQYKDATFMNIIKWRIINDLKARYDNIAFTYGYITKIDREALGLSKTHYNDAIAIAGGGYENSSIKPLYIKQVRKKKRSLHEATARKGRSRKGIKYPNITQKRNCKNTKAISVKGIIYAIHDKVRVQGRIGYISGFTGKQVYVKDIYDKYIQINGKTYKQMSVKNIRHGQRNNNWITQEAAV